MAVPLLVANWKVIGWLVGALSVIVKRAIVVATPPGPGRANSSGSRPWSLFWLTLVQSSCRMPPVSPELGFHDHQVQLMPAPPVTTVPLRSARYLVIC